MRYKVNGCKKEGMMTGEIMVNTIETADFSNQLDRFFTGWQEIQQQQKDAQEKLPFEQKLEQFFKGWRKVFIDDKKLSCFFAEYDIAQQPIRAAKAQGLALNVWTAAGLKRDEVRNSKVLKWFLDWRGDHGQGNQILVEFLKLLPQQLHYQPDRYFATAECCPLGKQDNRVDIEIDADEFLLFIEIKIDATEGEDQLQRYIDIAKAKAGHRKWCIVYLTKDGKLPEKYQHQENLKGISWSDISKILYQYAKNADVNNRGAWLAKQFAEHIGNF